MPTSIKDLVVRFREAGMQELQGSVSKAAKKAGDALDVLVRKAHETAAQLDAIKAGKLSLDIPVKDVEQKMARLLGQIRVKTDQELKKLGVTSEAVFGRIAEQSAQIGAAIRETGLTTGIDNLRLSAALLEKQLLADTVAARKLGIALQSSFAIDNLKARAAFETIASSKTATDLDKLKAKLALVKNGLLEDEAAARKLGTTLRATFATDLAEKRLALATLQRPVAPSTPTPITPAAVPADIRAGQLAVAKAALAELQGQASQLGVKLQASFKLAAAEARHLVLTLKEIGGTTAIDRLRAAAALLKAELAGASAAAQRLGFTLGRSFDVSRGETRAAAREVRESPVALPSDKLKAIAAEETAEFARAKEAADRLGVSLASTARIARQDLVAAFVALKESGKATDLEVRAAEANILAHDLNALAPAAQKVGVTLSHSFDAAAVSLKTFFAQLRAASGLTAFDKVLVDVRENQVAFAGLNRAASTLGVTLSRSFADVRRTAQAASEEIQKSTAATAVDKLRAEARRLEIQLEEVTAAANVLGVSLERAFAVRQAQARAAAATVAASPLATPGDISAAGAAAVGLRAKEALDSASKSAQTFGITLGASARRGVTEAVAEFAKLKAAAAAGIVSPVELIQARNALSGVTAEAAKSGTKLRSLGEAFGFVHKQAEGGRNAFQRYTGYLASLTFEVTGAVFGLTALGAALIAPFAAIGQVGGKFQQINQTLLSLGDSAEEAARGTEFFKEFFLSDVQQFTLDPLLNAFIKLKASGIDPLQGALLTLTDTISATGGGEQQLEKAALAISQIASKTRATAEEISGQLAEAIPGVIKKAAAANDQTVAQFLAAMQKGAVGARGFLENLFNELNRQFAGSGERLSGTFQGMINTLTKEWTRFLTLLGDAGLFREINAALKGFVDSLEAARADGSFQKFVESTATSLKVFGQGLLVTIGFIKEWGGTILTVIATLVGASVFKGLATILVGIAKLFATTLPAALAAFRANATLAGGAFVLLRTLGLGAIGPAGWLVALALVFYDLAQAVFGAEQKVDALGNRLQQLKDTKISFGGNLQAEVDENVKALTVLESRLRITQEALAQPFPVVGRGGISPLRDQLVANRKEIEKEIDTRKGIIKELQAQVIEAPKKVGGFEGIAPFDVSTVDVGEGAANQLRRVQLAAQLKGVEDRIKLEREGLDRQKRELEEGYASHLVSTKKFYEERTRITVAALETERELIAEKIRFEELALPGAKDETERVNLQANINSLKSEQLIIESKIGEEIAKGSKDSIKALDALALDLARVDDEIAEMEGRPSGSARQKFIEEYKDKVAELTAQLNEAIKAGDELAAGRARVGLAKFERLTVNKTSVQDLQELQDKFSKIQESAAQQEARISAETATALFPEFIARQRQVEVIKEQVAALEALRAEALAQQAINPNIPDIGNFLADIETQISVLRSSTNLLAIELNSALATNLVSVFDDLTDGIGSAGDAMDKFGKDFLGTVRKIIIDNFVRQLFGGILSGEPSSISQPTGTGSGIVNLLSSLVGISPKTGPAGAKKGLEDVTRTNPLPVAVVEGGLAGAAAADVLGVLPGQGPLGLAGGLLGGTGPLTIDQILAGAGAPGGAPIEEGITGAAESGGFFASILSGFKGFFGGLFDTLGGALKGLFGKGGEIFSGIVGIFSGLFHTGGVVGDAPRETRLVPLQAFANAARMHSGGLVGVRSNERPVIAQVGEEILSRDNPRHRDNQRGQNLAINIHPRALHMTLKDWLEGELGAIAAAR